MSAQSGRVVRVTHLTHAYKDVVALADVTLDVPAGQMVGVLGPDGVGKSTLLGLVAGARRLQKGNLEVLGGDMRSSRHRNRVGPRIAYMPQGLGKNLYHDLSIRENLDFFGKLFGQGGEERRRRISRLTRATGLFAFLDRPVGKLSGGMKQKLGLCCALIHDPDLLILDEPTTGVDPLSRRQFWEMIETIRADRPDMSVVVSTAYMDEAERFDWLVAMDAGRILATGSSEELKKQTGATGLEEAYIRLQPVEKRGDGKGLDIPPLADEEGVTAITARGLTKRFGNFTAVDDISFDIRAGEIFGFLGSNGCGKTTTMKMLTGLVPATEGEAFLFGNPVDAHDIATRRRVGFMSQSFSLYGELTVAQNLELHGRLFHLPPARLATRINELSERFGLVRHMGKKAGSLPLGIRQRLSLAVAIIHEPEMLILDEPTSGVDPVARDEFWALLVELSRRDKVTIFISTHFMNEAERCDRISLMHAGRVLACDKPARLAEATGKATLEEAFITYIEEAIAATAEPGEQVEDGASLVPEKPAGPSSQAGVRRGGRTNRLMAYSYRETLEVVRDPVRLAFAFLGSAILLIVISFGISLDVENLTFAALDLDKTPESRAYLHHLDGSRYFTRQPDLLDQDDLEKQLAANTIALAIEIPPDFGRTLKRGGSPSISAWIDGANTLRASTLEAYVAGGHLDYLMELAREGQVSGLSAGALTLEPRYKYNPSFETIYSIGPKATAMLLLIFPAVLMAVSMAREKEIGTITNFYVTPTNRLEFLIGKQLPYVAIGVLNYFILTFMVVVLLEVPLKGSLLALTIGAVLYVFSTTAFGLLVSLVTRSQVAAIFATAIVSLLPTIQFSGMIQPISTLEGGGRVIGMIWPARECASWPHWARLSTICTIRRPWPSVMPIWVPDTGPWV